MSVDSVSGTSGTGSTGSATTKKNDELGQDAFLQLMVAQMKNQDPTKPADPTQFLSQLAQFSTVSGIESMKDSISTLSDSLRSSQVLGGTSLVGHVVLADGDTASLAADGSVYGSATIPEGASDAYILVTDSSGQQVARVPLSTTKGDQTFTWDGTNGLGKPRRCRRLHHQGGRERGWQGDAARYAARHLREQRQHRSQYQCTDPQHRYRIHRALRRARSDVRSQPCHSVLHFRA